MTIEETITKAIEGGWDKSKAVKKSLVPVMHGMMVANQEQEVIENNKAFLDPNFWQSLGKAMGWDEVVCKACERHHPIRKDCDAGFGDQIPEWQFQWHRFIDHLAQGKKPEEFFESL